jgi:hypothetical protein
MRANAQLPEPTASATEALQRIREGFEERELISAKAYDSALLTLSSAALGLTFAFVGNYRIPGHALDLTFLMRAWMLWLFNLLVIVTGHFVSAEGMRAAIRRLDNKLDPEKGFSGVMGRMLGWLNALSGILFFVGVYFALIFARDNLNQSHDKSKDSASASAAATGTDAHGEKRNPPAGDPATTTATDSAAKKEVVKTEPLGSTPVDSPRFSRILNDRHKRDGFVPCVGDFGADGMAHAASPRND